jgi:hypothetical protein
MRKQLNSLERVLLAAHLESAYWASTIENKPGSAEFVTELVELEQDVLTGLFPYRTVPCSANLGSNHANPVL